MYCILLQGSFLPLLMWEGFPGLGSELCMLMAATLYVGNAMKDLVSAPRPLGLKYEKVRLSHISTSSEETKKNAEEYGLPSSHTMNSLCLNFYICHYLHRNDFLSNDMAIFWYTVVFLWVVWIAISRLYLGLHTPIDILAGAIAGLTVLTAFISVQDRVHQFMFSSNSWIFMIILSLILLRLHPMPEKPTPTYEFTTSFVGVAFGVIVAIHQYPAYYEEGITLGKISSLPILIHIVRVASGFGIVLLSKSVMKRVCTTILPLAYYGFPLAIRRLWQPPVHGNIDPKTSLKRTMNDRQWVDVDATVRFFSYASIGFSACYVVPKTFDIVHYLFVYYF